MRTKKNVVIGLAAAALVTGVGVGAGTASGSSGGSSDDEDSVRFTSSVIVADDDAHENETEGDEQDGAEQEGAEQEGDEQEGAEQEGDDAAHEAAEAAEDAALLKLPGVKVDAEGAQKAAIAEVPGTADSVELENEDGNVVWTVQVTDSAGVRSTVFVDPGTAQVLATKAHDHEDNDGPEGTEAPDGADD